MVDEGVKIWPFAPNWSDPVDVAQAYRTDVFTSRSGREQRRSLRRTPRRVISYSVTIAADDSRKFRRLVVKEQASTLLLPDPVRKVALREQVDVGATSLPIDTIPQWLLNTSKIVVHLGVNFEVFQIDTVDVETSSILVVGTSANSWAAGAIIRPALSGLVSSDLSTSHPTSSITQFRIDFSVDPGSEAEDEGDIGVYRFSGREVMLFRPNWGENVENGHSWASNRIDFGFGRTATTAAVNFGTETRRSIFVGRNPDEISEIECFFRRQRGQRGEFFMPSWLNDLPPKADLVEGGTTFLVEGTETFDTYADDPIYRSIAIMAIDGRWIFRSVTAMEISGTDTVLTVDRPWSTDLVVDDVAMICWLPVTRFAVDQQTTEWITDTVAQTTLAMQTVETLSPEFPIPDMTGAEDWLLETWGLESLRVFDTFDYLVNVKAPESLA